MMNGKIRITGSELHYQIEGQGDPLIFLHADTLDTRMWEKQVSFFKKKYQVICIDLRGFGLSDIPSSTPYSFSEDVKLVMDHLTIQTAHVIGLSMGAAVAIDLALTHPKRIASLILADPGIGGDGFDQHFIDQINTITSLSKEGNIDQAKTMWMNLDFLAYSKKNPTTWNNVTQMVQDTSGYRWHGINQPLSIHPSAITQLKNIHLSTLILVGDHDVPDFQRKATLLHNAIKESRFAIIPQAGHLSNMDNSVVFNQLMRQFLDTVQI